MLSPEFCFAEATRCEHLAREADDPLVASRWEEMASDWRLAGQGVTNDDVHRDVSRLAVARSD
jgi:hypothetical protein